MTDSDLHTSPHMERPAFLGHPDEWSPAKAKSAVAAPAGAAALDGVKIRLPPCFIILPFLSFAKH